MRNPGPRLRIGALAALVLSFAGPAFAQEDAGYRRGVTVHVYDVGEPVDGIPEIIEGQTPNVAYDRDDAALEGAVVEVRGWLIPMEGGWWMLNLDHPSF